MYMVWPLPIPSYELYCIDYIMQCLQYLVSNAVCDACCVCDDWSVAPLSTLVPCPSSRTTWLPYMVVARMKLSLHLLWPLNALVVVVKLSSVHPLRE